MTSALCVWCSIQDAFGRGERGGLHGVVLRLGGDAHGLINGVGEQALLGGMDRVEQAFAAEVAVFDDGEGAAIEREVGGVGDPESAQRRGLARRPERHALGVDLGLQDGDERGLILADGDGLGEVIGEVVVEGGSGGVGGDGGCGIAAGRTVPDSACQRTSVRSASHGRASHDCRAGIRIGSYPPAIGAAAAHAAQAAP